MRSLLLALLGLCALSTAATAQERQQEGGIMGPYVGRQRIDAPTIVCGGAFAIRLVAGESVERQEGPDFSLFYIAATDGPFLLYEGGYPQPHDDEVLTGQDFPSVIAIHDNRPAEARARSRVHDRLLTGDAFHAACPNRSARRTAWDGDFTYEVTEYAGPGHYCASGFVVRLEAGERILFLNPNIDFARMFIHLGGHRVQAFLTLTGSERRGSVVSEVPGGRLREIVAGDGASYEFGDPPGITSLDSRDFHGHAADGWFLSRIDLRANAARGLTGIHGSQNK
jgi:hypothetical protein